MNEKVKTDKKAKTIKVEMELESIDESNLYLREQLCSGKWGDVSFSVDSTMPGNSLIFNINEERYMLTLEAMTRAVITTLNPEK